MTSDLFNAIFPVEPVPWQRAIPVRGGGMRTAAETRIFENTVKQLGRYAMGPRRLLDMPLEVEVTFMMTQPDRFRKRPFPDVKNDIDNLTKALFDSLNGIVWTDDGRIVKVTAKKLWGSGAICLRVYPAQGGKNVEV